jgi:hypothetical protein
MADTSCVRHWSMNFISSSNPQQPMGRYYYIHSHLTEEETKSQKG